MPTGPFGVGYNHNHEPYLRQELDERFDRTIPFSVNGVTSQRGRPVHTSPGNLNNVYSIFQDYYHNVMMLRLPDGRYIELDNITRQADQDAHLIDTLRERIATLEAEKVEDNLYITELENQ